MLVEASTPKTNNPPISLPKNPPDNNKSIKIFPIFRAQRNVPLQELAEIPSQWGYWDWIGWVEASKNTWNSHNHGSGKWGPGRCVACLQMGYVPLLWLWEEGDLKCSLIFVVTFSWKHQLPGRMMKFSLRSLFFGPGSLKWTANPESWTDSRYLLNHFGEILYWLANVVLGRIFCSKANPFAFSGCHVQLDL